jgi:hypothetical protein
MVVAWNRRIACRIPHHSDALALTEADSNGGFFRFYERCWCGWMEWIWGECSTCRRSRVNRRGETFTNNLIMPEPCPFLRRRLPNCSVIRPTETRGAALGALVFLTRMGLFAGQAPKFFEFMCDLAEAADAATRMDG